MTAAALSWLTIVLLLPWLRQVASARPESRSSHRQPTPQGAGIAVTAATGITWLGAQAVSGGADPRAGLLAAALAGAMLLGFLDDLRPLPWPLKLALQALCAALAAAALPAVWQWPLSTGHAIADRAAAAFALVAVMNIINFIDGIDEITVAHAVPALALSGIAAMAGVLPVSAGLLAAAGLGAMLGFWRWNRHPARVFLGDAGSLPTGLLLGWLSLVLASGGHWAAGLLALAYPLADGGLTLLRRLLAGKRLTDPHRDHAYQRAVDSGLPAPKVSLAVFLVSIACGVLAVTSLAAGNAGVGAGMLAIGAVWVLVPIIGWLRRRSGG